MSSITGINSTQTSGAVGATSSGPASSTSSSQTSLSSLGSTFLQLLTQELQNQDPTAPVDSTQMVGQMISLNQLDQLASINQLLTTVFSGSSSTAGSAQSGASAQAKLAGLQSALASSNHAAATAGLTSSGTSAL
jgi:flagellar basal-body rod modification protein FlgD